MLTCLTIVRRRIFGSLDNAARATGIPRSTLQKAESGRPLSAPTRSRIERIYRVPLEELQKPFLGDLKP
jgi:hypothetical protein